MKKKINLKSAKQTEALAEKVGAALKGGETIELISDVGGGKTTFTRGLVRGMGSEDHVTSPTFTISNKYEAPKFNIWHFDFYRLPEAGLIEHQLHETVDFDTDVTIVEWSGVVEHVLPEERLSITIKAKGDDAREVVLDASEKLTYLIKDVDIDN